MAKGRKTGGRKKGTPNKMTANAREAIEQAFEGAGGVAEFTKWAREFPTEFYTRVFPRILPKEVELTGNPDKPLNAVIRWGDMEIPI